MYLKVEQLKEKKPSKVTSGKENKLDVQTKNAVDFDVSSIDASDNERNEPSSSTNDCLGDPKRSQPLGDLDIREKLDLARSNPNNREPANTMDWGLFNIDFGCGNNVEDLELTKKSKGKSSDTNDCLGDPKCSVTPDNLNITEDTVLAYSNLSSVEPTTAMELDGCNTESNSFKETGIMDVAGNREQSLELSHQSNPQSSDKSQTPGDPKHSQSTCNTEMRAEFILDKSIPNHVEPETAMDLDSSNTESDTSEEFNKIDVVTALSPIKTKKKQFKYSYKTYLKPPNTVEKYDALIAQWRPNLECELCHETWSTFSSLLQHFREQHPPEECYIR